MKKYLLNACAVVLAAALSAFTVEKKAAAPVKFANYPNWYRTTNGTTISAVLRENPTAVSESFIKSNYTTCPDNSGNPCVFGTTSDLDVGNNVPSGLAEDALIHEF